jgi:hypothetical protein
VVDVQSILEPYNPWWSKQGRRFDLPSFKRPIFHNLYEELKTLPQILSITGPRRVGIYCSPFRFVNSFYFRFQAIPANPAFMKK